MYYRTLVQEQVAAMAQGDKPAAVPMDGVPFYFFGRPRDEITTIIDVSDYAEAKLNGIRCHATQVALDSPFIETPDEMIQQSWFQSEHFILAHSTIGWRDGVETDLFARMK